MTWYVVRTKPRMEILAATLLEDSLNLKTYYPEVSVRRRGKVRSGRFSRAISLSKLTCGPRLLSAIDYTPGVLHLVRFQGEPQAQYPTRLFNTLRSAWTASMRRVDCLPTSSIQAIRSGSRQARFRDWRGYLTVH